MEWKLGAWWLIHQVPCFHSPAIIGNGALCGGRGWLCIGQSCRIELFEGVEGEGSVEGWILPRWVCGNWQVKPQGVEGGGTCVLTLHDQDRAPCKRLWSVIVAWVGGWVCGGVDLAKLVQ